MHVKNLRWVNVSTDICLGASLLMNEYGTNLFDAYHAATAISEDKVIVSTEYVYDRIKGIKRIELKDFVNEL